jgi:hypothetical protein
VSADSGKFASTTTTLAQDKAAEIARSLSDNGAGAAVDKRLEGDDVGGDDDDVRLFDVRFKRTSSTALKSAMAATKSPFSFSKAA